MIQSCCLVSLLDEGVEEKKESFGMHENEVKMDCGTISDFSSLLQLSKRKKKEKVCFLSKNKFEFVE